jgi:ABC-type branched-subunit amino acid transport system ATPase component
MVLNFGKPLIEGPTADILGNDQVAAVYLGTGGTRETRVADAAVPAIDGAIHVSAPETETRVLAPLTAPAPAEPTKAPALQLIGIRAGYGQARVLQGVDLTAQSGQAIAILGANGAGKTTLARTISGVIAPTAGALLIDGQDVSGRPPHRIAAMGVAHCMEGRRIFSTLSVRENLLIAARGADAPTARARLEAVYDLFPILAERRNQGGTSMSGGQQQMLAIGRALMARPRLVIFDEISLGLAPIVMDKLYEALALLKKARMTLIVIEQDVDRALALADHAYVLEHGTVALSGTPRQIADHPRLRHIYIGAAEGALEHAAG